MPASFSVWRTVAGLIGEFGREFGQADAVGRESEIDPERGEHAHQPRHVGAHERLSAIEQRPGPGQLVA